MRIRENEPPPACTEELRRKLLRMNRAEANRAESGGVFSVSELGGAPAFRYAHRNYVLTTEDILRGAGLEDARPRSWRYVVPQERGHAVAEVLGMQEEGRYRAAEVSEGLHSELVRETIEWLTDRPELGDDTYELRSLSVPSLLVDSIWVHPEQGRIDRFVAVHPVNPELEPQRLYNPAEFFERLRAIARRLESSANLTAE